MSHVLDGSVLQFFFFFFKRNEHIHPNPNIADWVSSRREVSFVARDTLEQGR